jgi:hypothetical protein
MWFRILALAVLTLCTAGWIGIGGRSGVTPTPATANIPVASLISGSYSANNWTGFTTNATTVSSSGGRQYIQTTTSSASNTLAIGTADWRDAEVTFYFTQGRAILRSTGQGGTGLQMSLGLGGGGLRISILSNIDYTSPEAGSTNLIYVQANPSSCITNWPTSADSAFTFGFRGVEAYLLIDGQPAYDTCQTTAINPLGEIRFYEYRAAVQNAGKVSVWAHSGSAGGGVGNQITATYYALTNLYSNVATNTFDIRDFGARTISAVTGSMSAGSCTLTLSGARDFRVRDRIIVEIGGESGAGARNTVGVGGTSPELHYADATARNADTSQATNTYSYLDTDGSTAIWNGSAWGTVPGSADGFPVAATYYGQVKAPVSLRATVTAVDSSPATTLTLKTFGIDADATCTKAATSGANVYLDSLPAFYPATTNPAETFVAGSTNGATSYQNMTVSIPSGTWYMSDQVQATTMVTGGRTGLTVTGQGIASTTLQSPKGVPSTIFVGGNQNASVTLQDFTYVGNLDDNGYMWRYSGTNKNFPGDTPVAMTAGNASSDALAQRVKCINDLRGCVVLEGTNPQILNSEVVLTVGQRTYFQWQFMLSNCTGGQINGITATGTYLLKTAELFACNGATMTNLTGTNMLVSVNSSTSTTLSNIDTTIQTDAYYNSLSGWLDEPVITINQNAFGSGNTGTLSNFRIVQSGYTQVSSKRSLKAIQFIGAQTDWTVSGSYPGGGGCTSALGGYIEAPNYDATSGSSYGAMGVYSDAARTTVTGVRIVGTAIGSPGLSSHYGNISLDGANSTATNNVADVLDMGGASPTTSGNQTNATFCP